MLVMHDRSVLVTAAAGTIRTLHMNAYAEAFLGQACAVACVVACESSCDVAWDAYHVMIHVRSK